MSKLYCDKPDRDVPKIKCGFPIPCPYHTVIIDTENKTLSIPSKLKVDESIKDKLLEIQKAIKK